MGYNVKLLFSPFKWLCCLMFVIMIPVFLYAPTYYDFTNISTMYIPFVGMVLFTDVVMIDKSNHFAEIAYLSDRKPMKTFLQRYFVMVKLLLVFTLIANGVFRISQLISGDFIPEPISLLEYILLTCGSSLMLGTLSMSIANVLNNLFVGYGAALLYWLYWNINYGKQSLLNLFPFIENPASYEKILTAEYLWIVILVILNLLLVGKSPFFLADHIRKAIVK
ncbi:ABC transporter permease [Brevibacillus brevis]|nr:ABC transporter permease [Brevibacillus brevis]